MNSDDDSDLDFGEIENLSSLQPAAGIVLPKHIAPPPPSACFVNIKAAKKRLTTFQSPELNEAAHLLLQPEVDDEDSTINDIEDRIKKMIEKETQRREREVEIVPKCLSPNVSNNTKKGYSLNKDAIKDAKSHSKFTLRKTPNKNTPEKHSSNSGPVRMIYDDDFNSSNMISSTSASENLSSGSRSSMNKTPGSTPLFFKMTRKSASNGSLKPPSIPVESYDSDFDWSGGEETLSATTSDSDSIITAGDNSTTTTSSTTMLKLNSNTINLTNKSSPSISPIHSNNKNNKQITDELINNATHKDPKTGIKNIPFKAPQAISINNMSYNPITQMWEGNEDDEEILEFDEIINETTTTNTSTTKTTTSNTNSKSNKKKRFKKEKINDLTPFQLSSAEEMIIKRRARQHLIDLKYPKHGVEARLIANSVKNKRSSDSGVISSSSSSSTTGENNFPIIVNRQYDLRSDLFLIRDMSVQRVALDNKKMNMERKSDDDG